MLKSLLLKKKKKLYHTRNEEASPYGGAFLSITLKAFWWEMIDVFLEIRYIIFCKRLHKMRRKENEYD